MAAAAKHLKTGMLKWKPDWDMAGAEYEKAAIAFRVAKATPQAIGAFVKASEANQKMASLFAASKHLESAAFLAKDLKQVAYAADLYEKASQLHNEDGRVDTAAEALTKAARTVEAEDAQRGAALMGSACDLFEHADDLTEVQVLASLETYKAAVAYLLRAKRYAHAASLLRRQARVHACVDQPHGVARCEFSCVIVLLAANDYESAAQGCEEAQARGDGFGGNDEAFTAVELLDAYAQQSAEALSACLAQQVFTYLDNQVTLLAKTLTLDGLAVPPHRLMASAAAAGTGDGTGSKSGGDVPPSLAAPRVDQSAGDFGEVAPEDDPTFQSPPAGLPAALPQMAAPVDDDDDLT